MATNAILLDVRNRSSNAGNSLQISYLNRKLPPKVIFKYGSSSTTKEYTLSLDSNESVNVLIRYVDGKLTITNNGATIVSNFKATITIDDMAILLGYSLNASGSVIRKSTATIYEFYVKEI